MSDYGIYKDAEEKAYFEEIEANRKRMLAEPKGLRLKYDPDVIYTKEATYDP